MTTPTHERAAPAPQSNAAAVELDFMECPNCNGTGESSYLSDNGPDAYEMPCDCPHCGGTGTLEAAYEGVVKLLRAEENKYRECAAILWLGRPDRRAHDRLREVAEYVMKPSPDMGWVRDRLLALADMASVAASSQPVAAEGVTARELWETIKILGLSNDRLAMQAITKALLPFAPDNIATEVCRAVAELPDRNSPEDWAEAMLVTAKELRSIVAAALSGTGSEVSEPLPPPALAEARAFGVGLDGDSLE